MHHWLDYFGEAEPVGLEEMLRAREERAEIQRGLLALYRKPLVSFTLNMPGAYKDYPLARMAFREGRDRIFAQLGLRKIPVPAAKQVEGRTGCGGFYVVDGDGAAVKGWMMAVEEGHPLGRLFDIDVLNEDGEILRGADHGRRERTCLLCGGPVWACARSRAHSAKDLAFRTASLLEDYFARRFGEEMAATATRALLYEVCATPKPGLVDRQGNGAHTDMDLFTFLDSSCALLPYFRQVAVQGLRYRGEPETLLQTLRYTGLQAEEAMFAATDGVNTHKGLIFSMGLVCAAMGYLRGQGEAADPDGLLRLCGRIASGTPGELTGAPDATQGQAAYARYGLTGVRGEAAAGFPSVREVGYPALVRYLAEGASVNDAAVAALLHLLAQVTDTNIIGRSDLETLRSVQGKVRALLEEDPPLEALLAYGAELDAAFVKWNISPGGCADLLALSLFLLFLFPPEDRKGKKG